MANPEHLEIVQQGPAAVAAWLEEERHHWSRSWLDHPGPRVGRAPSPGLDLREADLRNLDLRGADLADARLDRARLESANLEGTNLRRAVLRGAVLRGANLAGADLREATLANADLSFSHVEGARLGSSLLFANLSCAATGETDFTGASIGGTVFAQTDLSGARSLAAVRVMGPCPIDGSSIRSFGERLQTKEVEEFLQACGCSRWEQVAARLHDPTLHDHEIADVVDAVFRLRATGPLVIGGVFLSYAREDAGELAMRLREKLARKGVSCWLDKHDAIAGRVEDVLSRSLRVNDVVVVILSRAALESDWCEFELDLALQRAREEKREILCPIALDDAWQTHPKTAANTLRGNKLRQYSVVDFSGWRDDFRGPFRKLWSGLKIFYSKRP